MIENKPGGPSGFSQDSISITVGKQITIEQMIEKCIIMRISRYDHVYRHHVPGTSRPTPACIYYYYSTHRPLSNMHLEY